MRLKIIAAKRTSGKMKDLLEFLKQKHKKDLTKAEIEKEIGEAGFSYLENSGNITKSKESGKFLINKKASVSLTDLPPFDGNKEALVNWMKALGLSHVDEYTDHIDFYGETFSRLVKITWKQVRNKLWKSVSVVDANRPSGVPLEDTSSSEE